jgi:hypothetical protein
VIDFAGVVTGLEAGPDAVQVATQAGTTTVRSPSGGVATITLGSGELTLGGARPAAAPLRRLLAERPVRAEGQAVRVGAPPALDGSLAGFDQAAPLDLADEMHYVQSEEPYPGPDRFAATAYVNWAGGHLYLGVDVLKDEIVLRPADAPPLALDNEPEDIHSDGIQVYYGIEGREAHGYLIRPTEAGGILARSIPMSSPQPVELEGASARTEQGYCVTVALPFPELETQGDGAVVAFELCINEMQPGRVRRSGQLVWSGGGGWVYLRGDRQDPARWGRLEVVG